MSRFAHRHAVKDSGDTGSIICTVQGKGCWHRHGPEADIGTVMLWGPCPACVGEKSRNIVKRAPIWSEGVYPPNGNNK